MKKKVEKMNACIDRLIDESKALGQSSSQHSAALDMVKALGGFKNILINHPDARWGTPLNKSNKNLVQVTKQLFNPTLGKVRTEFQMTALDALGLNEKTNFVDIEDIQKWIDTVSRSVNPRDEALLQIYSSFLGLIKHNFLPKKAYKKNFAYLINCKYCYREIWSPPPEKKSLNELPEEKRSGEQKEKELRLSDKCHQHISELQNMGKYNEERFKKIFVAINKLPEIEMPYPYMLELLKSSGVTQWVPSDNNQAWIEDFLRKLDVCEPKSAKEIAEKLNNQCEKLSDLPEHFHRHWPIILNSTVFKYSAYTLATTKHPARKSVDKLIDIWQANRISTLTKYTDMQKKSLYRLESRWGPVICSLRKSSLPVSIIALTLNLEISDIKLALTYYYLK